ncbi:hypothetical protein DPMN_103190 [Dreissena polymorpha]|uniref:Uncharacterized protein n=1 Tax=Dreissena polymorpha TaxID=45954 RepID=A0A9D4K2A0_DREPO|nr:hypothetical protein DPMN_103190 [Dreissena polymorpha]
MSTRPTATFGTLLQHLLTQKSPYRRPSNVESWLGLDTILCARLFFRARQREVAFEAVKRKA